MNYNAVHEDAVSGRIVIEAEKEGEYYLLSTCASCGDITGGYETTDRYSDMPQDDGIKQTLFNSVLEDTKKYCNEECKVADKL